MGETDAKFIRHLHVLSPGQAGLGIRVYTIKKLLVWAEFLSFSTNSTNIY